MNFFLYASLPFIPISPLSKRPISMGKFPISQRVWREVAQRIPPVKRELPNNPSWLIGNELPVVSVSWLEAEEFCERLSVTLGGVYRLPAISEWVYAYGKSEWTYADRNMKPTITTENLQATDETYTWLTPFKQNPANQLGFYEMHGNVWEWTATQGLTGNARLAVLGRSDNLLAAYSHSLLESNSAPCLGFRVVREEY